MIEITENLEHLSILCSNRLKMKKIHDKVFDKTIEICFSHSNNGDYECLVDFTEDLDNEITLKDILYFFEYHSETFQHFYVLPVIGFENTLLLNWSKIL